MSIRAKFLGFVDVIMRIPPLFLLDEILKMNLFNENSSSSQLGSFTNLELNDSAVHSDLSYNQTETFTSSIDLYGLSITLLKCLVFLIGKFNLRINKKVSQKKKIIDDLSTQEKRQYKKLIKIMAKNRKC